MTLDPRPSQEPLVVRLVALAAGITGVAVALSNERYRLVFTSLIGVACVWWPHVMAHYTERGHEFPWAFVRILGWFFIAIPLFLLLT